MSEVAELSAQEKAFLEPFLPPKSAKTTETHGAEKESSRDAVDLPFVTLTYASSLDGMISLAPGVRTTLSGPETKSMTHYLRLHHDAILIGVGTAVADDPGLNSRYPGASLDLQPRPVIVDLRRRWNIENRKVLQLAAQDQGKAPWIVSNIPGPDDVSLLNVGGSCIPVEAEGVDVTPIIQQQNSKLQNKQCSWTAILRSLKVSGIESVMIEGGAHVINTLLAEPELLDSVIVTLAPTWLGAGGVTVTPAPKHDNAGERVNAASVERNVWRQFGADVVLCGSPKS